VSEFSILAARKKLVYRILESVLGISSLVFLVLLLILSFWWPTVAAVFLIVYSFFWLLRVNSVCLYTIYSYKNLRRWESFNLPQILASFDQGLEQAKAELLSIQKKYAQSLDWKWHLQQDINYLPELANTKFSKPSQIVHIPIFSVYNESPEILIRSLEAIYKSGYDLSKIIVFVTQEARLGKLPNQQFRQVINQLDWVNSAYLNETNLDLVYRQNHFTDLKEYTHPEFAQFQIKSNQLNLIFTEHPDGLTGEIKGKASNEDWAGRQASLFVQTQNLDPELVLITSLDVDSRVGKNFFHLLSLRFCLTPDRFQCGFQPIPVYSNNFLNTGLIPRLIATQTTLYQFAQNVLEEEAALFANYSVPLVTLRQVNFWVREGIAEDYLLFAKCYLHFGSHFRVIPFYGIFEGDAVEADDYLEAITNQYKQLQRWSWGGVESFPYLVYNLFFNSHRPVIPLTKKLAKVWSLFSNHFFWATTPIIFSLGVFLPGWFGGEAFKSTPTGQSLANFSSIFATISLIFLSTFTYITFQYIAPKAKPQSKLSYADLFRITAQWLASPILYGLMSVPALDSQLRGVLGKYLGYWVTPKK
jgi:hypothetical protein